MKKLCILLVVLFFISCISYAAEKNIPLSIVVKGTAQIEDNNSKENAISNARENFMTEVTSLFTFEKETDKEILLKDFSYIQDFKVIENSEIQENNIYSLSCSGNVCLNDIYKNLSKKSKVTKPKVYISVNQDNDYNNQIYNDINNKFTAMGFIVLNKNDLNITNENNIKEILSKNKIKFVLNVSSFTKIKVSDYQTLSDAKTKSKDNDNSKMIAMINESDNIEKRIDANTNLSLILFDVNRNKEIYSIENKGFATGAAKENNTDSICSSSISDAIDNIFTDNTIEINNNKETNNK